MAADGQMGVRVGDALPKEVSDYLQSRVNAHLAAASRRSARELRIKVMNDAVKQSISDLQRAQPAVRAKSTPVADYRAGYEMQKDLLENAAGEVIEAELNLGVPNVNVW
jgi:hypothetical protein